MPRHLGDEVLPVATGPTEKRSTGVCDGVALPSALSEVDEDDHNDVVTSAPLGSEEFNCLPEQQRMRLQRPLSKGTP
ncbi:hypothetical protein [Mycolicibacterium vanbaalenii]|nr:hypothetical protein [Mycolicibacterium vanbaalenii]